MVHIKKIEIFGFKSFGSKKISLNFGKGLIAVTGPNGSGKSNILDAILFALGENSPKALRVDRFQSLFHDNTANKNSNIIVKVSLTFDNIDRGIPMDNDQITITREMSVLTSGESQYYLNNKKVSRNNILELLEIVVASPNKLNIVQQGMITRISELNPDERRKIIEDIIGLSYFDEKKNQGLKQLEESDRRLDIALAKMNEVRNRITELETERNEQFRYIQLENEINRLKAIKTSKILNEIDNKIINFNKELQLNEQEINKRTAEVEEITEGLSSLSKEKENFLIDTNNSNKEKKEVETKLSAIIYQYERNRAIVKETEQSISQLRQKIETNQTEQELLIQHLKEFDNKTRKNNEEIQKQEKIRNEKMLKSNDIAEEIKEINLTNLNEINNKNFFDKRLKKIVPIKNIIEIKIARNEEAIKNKSDKIINNDKLILDLLLKEKEIRNTISDNNSSIIEKEIEIDKIAEEKRKNEKEYSKLNNELETSNQIIKNAETMVLKFGEKMKIAKNNLSEDYAIATLIKDFKKLEIIGYVFNLLKWNKKYQKAIISSGNDWMKAIVVKDIKSMINLTEFSKNNGITFLKIIPKDILRGERIRIIPDEPAILGILSDFISSEIENLSEFLFGNILLTKNPLAAYMLSKKGYKAVSISGEIFYPNLSTMQFDYGSKISDLTKDILLSDSIENLKSNAEKLAKITHSKFSLLKELLQNRRNLEKRMDELKLEIDNIKRINTELETKTIRNKEEILKNCTNNFQISKELDSIMIDNNRNYHRIKIISQSIDKINYEINKIENNMNLQDINLLNKEKDRISKELEIENQRINQLLLNRSMLKNNIENASRQNNKAINEAKTLEAELENKKTLLEDVVNRGKNIEKELNVWREKENEIIQKSSSTYSKLQEYEYKIRKLSDEEKRKTKELNQIEKDTGFLKKDILNLENQKVIQNTELLKLGYKEVLEHFEIESLYQDLKKEYENIRERINFRADETYQEIIDGYRGMSSKKNQLEEERNSIVKFIDEIGKEKENVFMEAFNKVNQDIKKTFADITGGNAWLELENQEDIFSGGILLMVQFPRKPPRESTALSGGEKTMAGIIFLLALQSLKPSPFYLMDEVDAHLDAQNTERLSKVLALRSINNQIIMVTLKDSTVSKSDMIFGVYPKNGISQVVKYDHPNKVKVEINQ